MKVVRFLALLVAVLVLGGMAVGSSVALLVPAAHAFKHATSPLCNDNILSDLDTPAVRSEVFDRSGKVMTTLFTEDRAPVKLSDVPQSLINAVISIEDRKFYEHNGVDIAGTIRALTKNVDAGGISQGGSTITQQLVKNTMSLNRKRDLKTKARESVLAVCLERKLTKNQILERYLNVVYFGNGAYGVQAAAERYFDKPLKQLTVADSALLAGLIQAPEALNPITHPDLAARRRAEVLDAEVATRKLTTAEANAAKSVPLPTKVSNPLLAKRDYYMDEVIRQLLNDNEFADALGPTVSARYNAIFRGGLKIYTSYDPILQYIAGASVSTILPQQATFTAAVVVIDNSDGGVRAIVAGKNFGESQFNLATQSMRQAGSSFKGITLATALSNGYSPNDQVSGSPLSWKIPGQQTYNLSGDCHGNTPTLTQAIAISDNCAFVRTELSLGPSPAAEPAGAQKVLDMAGRMGIDTSKMSPVVSTTLGTNPVSPLEMAQAYSVIAQDGIMRPARFVTKIVAADGKVLYQAKTTGTRVLTQNTARTETEMLKHVITDGTASGTANIGRPAAGKTGTTDHNIDAWFVGYTPQFTAAVWMGDPNGETPMRNVGGITVFGATYPARIWAAVMKAATASMPAIDFPAPDRSQWPTPQFIDQFGRRFSTRFAQPAPSTIPPVTPSSGAPTTLSPSTLPTEPSSTTPSSAPASTSTTGP